MKFYIKISGFLFAFAIFFFSYGLAKAYYYVDSGSSPNLNLGNYSPIYYNGGGYYNNGLGIKIHPTTNTEIQTIESFISQDVTNQATSTQTISWEIWRGNTPTTFYGKTNDYDASQIPTYDDINHDAPHNDYSYFQFVIPIQLEGGYDYWIIPKLSGGNETLYYLRFYYLTTPDNGVTDYFYTHNNNTVLHVGDVFPIIKLGDSGEALSNRNLTIEQPINNSPSISLMTPGSSMTVSGFCPENGANKVGIKNSRWTSTQKLDSSQYTVTCSDHHYSVTGAVPSASNFTIEACGLYSVSGQTYYTCDQVNETLITLGSTVYSLTLNWPSSHTIGNILSSTVHPTSTKTIALSATTPNAQASTTSLLIHETGNDFASTTTSLINEHHPFNYPMKHFYFNLGETADGQTRYFLVQLVGDDGLVKKYLKMAFIGCASNCEWDDQGSPYTAIPDSGINPNANSGIGKLITYLQGNADNNWERICGKIPFNYVCDFVSVAQDMYATTTNENIQSVSVDFPAFPTINQPTTTIVLFTQDKLFELIPLAYWTMMKLIVSAGLIITSFLYCWRRMQSVLTHGY